MHFPRLSLRQSNYHDSNGHTAHSTRSHITRRSTRARTFTHLSISAPAEIRVRGKTPSPPRLQRHRTFRPRAQPSPSNALFFSRAHARAYARESRAMILGAEHRAENVLFPSSLSALPQIPSSRGHARGRASRLRLCRRATCNSGGSKR